MGTGKYRFLRRRSGSGNDCRGIGRSRERQRLVRIPSGQGTVPEGDPGEFHGGLTRAAALIPFHGGGSGKRCEDEAEACRFDDV